jgi:hypothetical protein
MFGYDVFAEYYLSERKRDLEAARRGARLRRAGKRPAGWWANLEARLERLARWGHVPHGRPS